VANQKGGVAKTTTVASLGMALSELNRRVLVVDLDPQACLTFSLGVDPEALDLSIHDVFLGRVGAAMAIRSVNDHLDLLPSSIDLTGSEVSLHDRAGREYVLRTMLDEVRSDYDFVLIDCSPSLGVLTINALTASDEVLIPLQCETLSHRGVGQLLDTIADVRRLTNSQLDVLGVIPTMFDGRTTHSRAVLNDVTERFGVRVLEPPIQRSIRFAEAPASGESILTTASTGPGAMAYRTHAQQLVGQEVAA
jgi:chromosome partitioning protein